jgi:hypothetical protein
LAPIFINAELHISKDDAAMTITPKLLQLVL